MKSTKHLPNVSTPKAVKPEQSSDFLRPTSCYPEFYRGLDGSEDFLQARNNTAPGFLTPTGESRKSVTPRTPNYKEARRGDQKGKCDIPCITNPKTGSRRCRTEGAVHSDMLVAIKTHEMYKNLEVKIYDCRFPFEYHAGHILGAQNMYLPSQALKILFDPLALPKSDRGSKNRTILILHCEFSTHRAPDMANFIRQMDRDINLKSGYPQLCYPQIFLLEGGYSEVYA